MPRSLGKNELVRSSRNGDIQNFLTLMTFRAPYIYIYTVRKYLTFITWKLPIDG